MTVVIDLDRDRRQPFRETNAFFQRFLDFLVIERIRRTVDETTAIGDGRPAPALEQLQHPRWTPLLRRRRALGADSAGMSQIFLRDVGLGGGPRGFDFLRTALGDELLVARQKFLDLHRIISERFGRGIDRRQAAADDHDRQADLHVGHRIHTRGAGELQRHQEIRRGANAVGEPVRKLEHRRPPGAGRQCNVIEPEREGAFGIDRAAETHAAKQREALAAFDQQSNDFEEVLIPAHRDAILGDAAKAGHHARFERLVERGDIPDGVEGHAVAQRGFSGQRRRQWLDFQSIDADYRVSVVEKMVRERKSRRTHADHQYPLAGRLRRYRTPQIERIPAREQAVELESPRQRQHILQRARLRLRNVDRFLLLVNA